MKNILVPTDFSENAFNAIKYALTLHKNEECTFFFLNVYTPAITHKYFMHNGLNYDNDKERDYLSKQGLKKTIERIKAEFWNAKHTYKTYSSPDTLTSKVKEIIDKENIELIILGNKGHSNLNQIFLGSNAVRILQSIKKCPVIIVPNDAKFTPLSEIAFATDFNKFYTKSEIAPILSLATSFDATVRVVHVQKQLRSLSDIQRFNLNILRKHFSSIEYYVHTVSETHSMSRTLGIFVEELQIHLLAMLNYPQGYMKQLVNESDVKQEEVFNKIPLLVIPELSDSYLEHLHKKDKESIISV
ncbi:universal stress protein [Aquimarina algicola]|uniref:Universal stress protein n=1 Tax=Aquimarina algicola TaxID=2589995 RepID=A0A504IX58_9FLAO|nr:universal stress protein [Aquimarina algicola]TPN82996.1 universal stress protein [Aquimarina algicola]